MKKKKELLMKSNLPKIIEEMVVTINELCERCDVIEECLREIEMQGNFCLDLDPMPQIEPERLAALEIKEEN